MVRLDLTPSEMVAVKRAVEESEKAKAKERQGTRTDLELGGKFPQGEAGKTRDKAAALVGETLGMSGRTSSEKAAGRG